MTLRDALRSFDRQRFTYGPEQYAYSAAAWIGLLSPEAREYDATIGRLRGKTMIFCPSLLGDDDREDGTFVLVS